MKNYDKKLLEKYINFLIKYNLTSNNNFSTKTLFNNFDFYLKNTFKKLNFKNKKILDIGSGNCIFSFFSLIKGAKQVICLEPSLDGSNNNNKDVFDLIKNEFNFKNITFLETTLQDFIPNYKFDMIILKDSINHINENACINLKKNNENIEIYKNIFDKLYALMSSEADIFISDCSSKNFFGDLNIKNPFVHEIEWFKHQEPQIWINLMKNSKFRVISLDWSTLNSLKFLGKFNNSKLLSYFTSSNFRIIGKI